MGAQLNFLQPLHPHHPHTPVRPDPHPRHHPHPRPHPHPRRESGKLDYRELGSALATLQLDASTGEVRAIPGWGLG